MELEVPKRPISKPTLSIDGRMDEMGFVVREAKKVLSLQMLGDHGREMCF